MYLVTVEVFQSNMINVGKIFYHSRYGEQKGASVGCSCVGGDGVWEEMYTTVVLLETVSCYHTYQTLLSAHTETLPTIT